MKILAFTILGLIALSAAAAMAAADITVPAAMQHCTSNAECTMVSSRCTDNCADLPVNKNSLASVDTLKAQRCGASTQPPANEVCRMNPPMESTCINNRCTVGYAFQHHADPQDYKPGAYPVPEQPVAPAPQTQGFNGVNDRDGSFSAYNLPQEQVRQNVLGQYNFKQGPSATEETATSASPNDATSVQ